MHSGLNRSVLSWAKNLLTMFIRWRKDELFDQKLMSLRCVNGSWLRNCITPSKWQDRLERWSDCKMNHLSKSRILVNRDIFKKLYYFIWLQKKFVPAYITSFNYHHITVCRGFRFVMHQKVYIVVKRGTVQDDLVIFLFVISKHNYSKWRQELLVSPIIICFLRCHFSFLLPFCDKYVTCRVLFFYSSRHDYFCWFVCLITAHVPCLIVSIFLA